MVKRQKAFLPTQVEVADRKKLVRSPTDFERTMLRLIAEQFAIPLDQLARFVDMSCIQVRDVVARMEEQRWVASKQFLTGDESWVWLRSFGKFHAGTGFQTRTPSVTSLEHRRALNEARLELAAGVSISEWVCERQLHRELKGKRCHVPDGVFVVAGKRYAVEVELTLKSASRLLDIVLQHSCRYDAVIYFCAPKVMRHMRRSLPLADLPQLELREISAPRRLLNDVQWRTGPPPGAPRWSPCTRALSDHELDVVDLLAEQGAIPLDQLARFLVSRSDKTRELVSGLVEAGVVRTARPLPDEPDWAWLSTRGAVRTRTGLSELRPHVHSLPKMRIHNEVRLYIVSISSQAHWLSSRIVRKLYGRSSLPPAAVVEIGTERHAIEIVSTREMGELVASRLSAGYEGYDAVVCFCFRPAATVLIRVWESGVYPELVVKRLSRTGRVVRPRKGVDSGTHEVDPTVLPGPALAVLASAIGSDVPPRVFSAAKVNGPGAERFVLGTVAGSWSVNRTATGWSARLLFH